MKLYKYNKVELQKVTTKILLHSSSLLNCKKDCPWVLVVSFPYFDFINQENHIWIKEIKKMCHISVSEGSGPTKVLLHSPSLFKVKKCCPRRFVLNHSPILTTFTKKHTKTKKMNKMCKMSVTGNGPKSKKKNNFLLSEVFILIFCTLNNT
jgi:hypothetical protein